MEVLCVALHEAITAIISYTEDRLRRAAHQHEEDEEKPQNLMVKMENFEGKHPMD
jgi:hypothetical protein